MKLNKKLKALTLTELLVVMVIMGVLVLLVLPNLTGLVTDAHDKEAEAQLVHLHGLEQRYKLRKFKFSQDLKELGFTQATLATDDNPDGAKFRITVTEASKSTFTAQAEAVIDFDDDGELSTWTIDQDKKLTHVIED